MPTIERRITNTVGTIPDNTVINGTVTSNTDTTILSYTGTVNLARVYLAEVSAQSLYVYVDASTEKTAQVNQFVQTAFDSNTGIYDFAIHLNGTITGASAATIAAINANLLAYSYKNDGGANGTVNGVTIPAGTPITEPQLSPAGSRVKFQEPVVIDATGTDFLILQDS